MKGRPASFIEFDAPDVDKQHTCELGFSQFWWRYVGVGLNYGGRCSHKSCLSWTERGIENGEEGYEGYVNLKMGLGTFRPNEDMDYGIVRCPVCNSKFTPTELGFVQCGVEINYCKKGQTPQSVKTNTNSSDECEVFGGGTLAVYTSLIVTVDEPEVHTNIDPFRNVFKSVPMQRECTVMPKPSPRMFNILEENLKSLQISEGESSGFSRRHTTFFLNGEMAPKKIRFCQDSIADKFRCGRRLVDTLIQLKNKTVSAFVDIPPIRVFEWNGKWFTEDNRRLKVFQDAKLKTVPVLYTSKANVDEDKLTTVNEGVSIKVRGLSYCFWGT